MSIVSPDLREGYKSRCIVCKEMIMCYRLLVRPRMKARGTFRETTRQNSILQFRFWNYFFKEIVLDFGIFKVLFVKLIFLQITSHKSCY